MQIRIACERDLDALVRIYDIARRYMAESGNPHQWGDGRPTRDELAASVAAGAVRVGVDEGDTPRFAFTVYSEADPTYQRIYEGSWLTDGPYVTIHRVASDGQARGVFSQAVAYATDLANQLGIPAVRVDTHDDNKTMQHVIAKAGFTRCGYIHLENGDPRIAYELKL